MKETEKLKLQLPEGFDYVRIEVLNKAFETLETEIDKVSLSAFNMDTLAQNTGGKYSLKVSGTDDQPVYTEVVTKSDTELARRTTTALSNGNITVHVISAPYGINSKMLYTPVGGGYTAEVTE